MQCLRPRRSRSNLAAGASPPRAPAPWRGNSYSPGDDTGRTRPKVPISQCLCNWGRQRISFSCASFTADFSPGIYGLPVGYMGPVNPARNGGQDCGTGVFECVTTLWHTIIGLLGSGIPKAVTAQGNSSRRAIAARTATDCTSRGFIRHCSSASGSITSDGVSGRLMSTLTNRRKGSFCGIATYWMRWRRASQSP